MLHGGACLGISSTSCTLYEACCSRCKAPLLTDATCFGLLFFVYGTPLAYSTLVPTYFVIRAKPNPSKYTLAKNHPPFDECPDLSSEHTRSGHLPDTAFPTRPSRPSLVVRFIEIGRTNKAVELLNASTNMSRLLSSVAILTVDVGASIPSLPPSSPIAGFLCDLTKGLDSTLPRLSCMAWPIHLLLPFVHHPPRVPKIETKKQILQPAWQVVAEDNAPVAYLCYVTVRFSRNHFCLRPEEAMHHHRPGRRDETAHAKTPHHSPFTCFTPTPALFSLTPSTMNKAKADSYAFIRLLVFTLRAWSRIQTPCSKSPREVGFHPMTFPLHQSPQVAVAMFQRPRSFHIPCSEQSTRLNYSLQRFISNVPVPEGEAERGQQKQQAINMQRMQNSPGPIGKAYMENPDVVHNTRHRAIPRMPWQMRESWKCKTMDILTQTPD
ncbi:hypothetical protein ACRALDRAFT_2017754 [Sodiomyces alcalophilus JCM 7366]|uniref:uncharacterized protein n=1 Tax=Sodiomyces alcalophilus JCM 7366 TaxID=591952 RepID=UPI0039B5F4FC